MLLKNSWYSCWLLRQKQGTPWKKASDIFAILRHELLSESLLRSSRMSPKAFVRKRSLTFPTIASLVLNLLKKSIPKELNNFSKQLQIKRTSRSSVTQARAKFSPQAFVKLNKTLIEEFYNDNHFKTLSNFIILAIDGSTLQLPNSPEIIEKFGFASNQTENTMSMARISMLYDTLNGLTLDAQIKPYNASERDIAIEHFEAIKSLNIDFNKILVVFDRGYPHRIFKSLYFNRWNIEEGYKFYKSGVEIENFSGQSALSVEQDFHATVLATNAHALLSLEALAEIQKEEVRINRKYEYAVNKRVSIEELKHEFVKILLKPEYDIEVFCSNVKQMMKKDRIPIRPERSYKRIVKHQRRKYHLNQR